MKRLSKNVLSVTISDITRRFIGFLTLTYLTRHLSVDQFGIINIGFTILSYAILASSFGLSGYGARAIARGESPELINQILSIRFIASAVSLIGILVFGPILIDHQETSLVVMVMSIAVIPYAFLLDWFFQGKERMGIIGFARLSSSLIYLLIIIFFVHSSKDIFWVAFSSLASDTVNSMVLWIIFKKEIKTLKIRFNLTNAKDIIRSSMPIGIGSILGSLTVNLPTLAIGIFLTNYEVGIFSAAIKFVFFLLMFDRVLSTIFLPASTRLLISSPDSLINMMRQARKWIVIITLPICIGGTLLADKIIMAVFGSAYLPAAMIFKILIWFFFATILHTIYSSGMIASGNEKRYGNVMIIGSVLYVVFIFVGTIVFGVSGSAVGMVLAEIGTLVIMVYRFNQFISLGKIESFWKIILSVLIMGGVIAMFPQIHFSISVVAGAVIYFVLLFILKAINSKDIKDLISRFV